MRISDWSSDVCSSVLGLPIGMKDLFCTEGVLTTAGSHILDGFHPTYESTVSRHLWDAGAVLLGKTNLDEFAMGSSNMTSFYGGVENLMRTSCDHRPLVTGGPRSEEHPSNSSTSSA